MRLSLLISFLAIGPLAEAQNFFGISTSTGSGTNGLYLNPASIADSRHKFYFNVLTGGLHVNNNYAYWNAPFSVLNAVTGRVPVANQTANGSVAFQPNYFRERSDDGPKNGTVWAEVRGPSAMITLSDYTAIAFSTRLRASGQVTGASKGFISLLRDGFNTSSLWNVTNVDNRFNVNANMYGELAGTLAQVITPLDRQHFVKVGFTAKYLTGFYTAHFINRGLTYHIQPNETNTDKGVLVVDKVDAEFGYSQQTPLNGGFTIGKFLGSKVPGLGWGFDAGIVYEFRPWIDEYHSAKGYDREEDKYRFRIGVALLDMGRIYYSDPNNVHGYTVQRTNKILTEQDFNDVSGSDDLVKVIEQKLDLKPAEAKHSFNVGLPTALSLNLDWRLGNEFYINVAYIQNLHGAQDIAMRQPTVLAITPRLTAEGFIDISFPLVFVNNAFSPGVALRLGPIFVGSDNILGVFGSVKSLAAQGSDVYAGLAIPILRSNKK